MRQITALVAALVAGASVLASQPPPAQETPRFRSSVELVHLDVSVLDSQRRPVRQLKPSDFTILEDGKPQSIAVFQAVDIPEDPPPSAEWLRAVAPDVRDNTGADGGRLFMIVMDDAAMQADLRGVSRAREIAKRFVDNLHGSDRAAVIFTLDNRNAQDYTDDRAALHRAIDRFKYGGRNMAPRKLAWTDIMYYMPSVDTMFNAVAALSSIPDRRKAIVYVGQGIPFDPGKMGPTALGLNDDGSASAASENAANSAIRGRLLEIYKRAARDNISVYTLDVCGLRTIPPTLPVDAQSPAATCAPGLEMDYLKGLADQTGGRAFLNTNDLTPGVDAIYRENASYYLLGFSSSAKPDGRTRRLEVRVNVPGVTVRTRNGYRSTTEASAAEQDGGVLRAALAGIVPKSDLPLRVVAVPFPVHGWREAVVAIAVGVQQPIRAGGQRTVERVELQVSAFDVNGKAHGTRTMRADVTIREGASGLAEYEVISRIELKPGRYQLRLAAHVGSLRTSGSIYADVDVPDFGSTPWSMTGIFAIADPAPVAAPRDALRPWVPVVPTTRRTFGAQDRLSVMTRLFRGGKQRLDAVPLKMRLTNEAGAVVIDRAETVGVERFVQDRYADLLIDLPVSRLPPGQYLLTVEALPAGRPIRRDLRFRIAR